MKKTLIKLDSEMLEPFSNDEMLVVRGGVCIPCIVLIAEILWDVINDDDEADNCDCNNCSCS